MSTQQTTKFGDLKVGARFGFLEGSDVDHPYSKTGRVLVKTRLNEKTQYEDENYINAVSLPDGDLFLIREDEYVAVLNERQKESTTCY